MPTIRDQYYLRKTNQGMDAWKVRRLIGLSKGLPVKMIDPGKVSELHENHWYFHNSALLPTPNSIIEHIQLIRQCDLAYPVILDREGRVMDGMHRICKAILEHVPEISAVQFTVDPEPDISNCRIEDLSYDG